jgi:hypothetical protein
VTLEARRGEVRGVAVASHTRFLLTHLARIARRHVRSTVQVWRLSAPDRGPETFRDLADSAEERSGWRIRDYRLPEAELGRPVL